MLLSLKCPLHLFPCKVGATSLDRTNTKIKYMFAHADHVHHPFIRQMVSLPTFAPSRRDNSTPTFNYANGTGNRIMTSSHLQESSPDKWPMPVDVPTPKGIYLPPCRPRQKQSKLVKQMMRNQTVKCIFMNAAQTETTPHFTNIFTSYATHLPITNHSLLCKIIVLSVSETHVQQVALYSNLHLFGACKLQI